MTVIAILAVWWLLLFLVAWALCRTAHDSDIRIERMWDGWRNDDC